MNKKDFPIFDKHKELVYLNSAATSQKPQTIIDSVKEFYEDYNSNVHRGSDSLSVQVEVIYNNSRKMIAEFLNAGIDEIVFTKSCTEAINLVASGFDWKKGDKVVVTVANHHSNFVPWKMLEKKGVQVEVLDINTDNGELILDESKIKGAKLLAITHVSNVMGNELNVKNICEVAHEHNCLVLVDGAQSVGHMKVDVQNLGVDFLTFSGHKMFSINGVGVLYGKHELLEKLNPLIYGGDMVGNVTLNKVDFAEVPRRFEGGTLDLAAVYSLEKAIEYINKIGLGEMHEFVEDLTGYALGELKKIEGVKIYGDGKHESGIVSFNLMGIHPHDVSEFLSPKGVAVRSGHMCCQPLIDRLGVNAVVRASFQIYNDKNDVDILIRGLKECVEFFGGKE